MLHIKNYIKILKWIWFSENSSNIYLSLIQNWESSIAEISKNTWLHRIQIYRLLPYLIESWFVYEIKIWKRKIYKWENPEKINDEYKKLFEVNKTAIDTLKNTYSNLEKKTTIKLSKWLKWINEVYDDIINSMEKWEIFYRITSELDVDKVNNYYIPKWYKEKRDKKDIQRIIIMTDKTALKKKPKLEREIKIIDSKKEDFDDNIIYTIYSDKISFVDLNSETSIIIESKEIADFQRKIFKMLYKKL